MAGVKNLLATFNDRYTRAGIREEFDSQLNRRIWVTNVFGMALGATVANYIWIFWLADLVFLALFCIPVSLFYLFMPMMNRRGHVDFTRTSFPIVAHVVILFYSLSLGQDADIHLLFLLAAAYAFLFFTAKERVKRWVTLCFNIISLCAFIAYFEFGGEALFPLSSSANNVISRLLFLTTLFLITLVTYFFFYASNDADARLKRHLGELEGIVAERTAALTRTNKELRDSEEKFRTVITSSRALIYAMDMDGIITLSEGKGLAVLGLRPGEVVGRSALEMYKSSPEVLHALQRALTGKSYHQLVRMGDLVFDTIFSPYRDSDGSLLGVIGISIDVTDRERAEEARKESEEVLRATFESMKEGVLVVGENGRISHYNKRFSEIWSFPEGALARGDDVELRSHARDQLTDPETLENPALEINNSSELLEDELRFKDGRLIRRTSCPLIKDGEQAGRAWFYEDVTAKTRMEEMLVQAEKMGSLGGLAAGMAHEINNPLAGILQNAEVAKRRLCLNTDANEKVAEQVGISLSDLHRYLEQRKIDPLLDNIIEAGTRAARIVKNMLGFSYKSTGEFEPYSLSQLMEDTIELASSEYDLKKNYDFRQIAIHRDFDADLSRIMCQKAKLQQVFLNLLKNAAHAVSEAGVENPRIDIVIHRRREMVEVVFQDNGCGFDEVVRKRVFEPFFTTKDVGEGTGLGLSVSYFIVTEDHGGQMMVESEKGRGTKFTVVLPIARQGTAPG